MRKHRVCHQPDNYHRRCCGGSRWFWGIMGVTAGIYLLGKHQRPAERQALVEAIDTAEVTDAWARLSDLPQFRVMREYVTRRVLAGQRRSVRVLDVGCGAGQLTMKLAQQSRVKEAVGIDLSHDLVDEARRIAEEQGINATFMQVDAAEMPFPDGAFDLVVSTLSLHHWNDPQRVLQEIARILSPGGRAVIFDIRRDASPFFWGIATLVSQYIVPAAIRSTGEPLASFQASYTACEALLFAFKAGWTDPTVSQGPTWLQLEFQKQEAA